MKRLTMMLLAEVVLRIPCIPGRCAGQSSLSMASSKAFIRPATDGSPVKTPSELLLKYGAVAQMLASVAVR